MEVMLVRVTTAGHRANPYGPPVRAFIRLATHGRPIRYLYGQSAPTAAGPPDTVSPPVHPVQIDPAALADGLRAHVEPFTGSSRVTAFLVNGRMIAGRLHAWLAVVDGDRADDLLTTGGLRRESVDGLVV